MNLSISSYNWNLTEAELFQAVVDNRFNGAEIVLPEEIVKSGIFDPANAARIKRTLADNKIVIAALNSALNIAEYDEKKVKRLSECLTLAANLGVENVTVYSHGATSVDDAVKTLSEVLPLAEKLNKKILVESSYDYAQTEELSELLNAFASDDICACWDARATTLAGELPKDSIRNLGAYVSLVHVTDADEKGAPVLFGEGILPVKELVNALDSINYAGQIVLVWDPKAYPEYDLDVILTQFASTIKKFQNEKNKKHLYYNLRHTGRFVWKKESLIDCTFGEVLDVMAKEFPDQIAFKYTTLDYTRTYAEFRDDVNTFARALVGMGVKAGSHVAVWATNVPEWYIAFWAVTKIGAVLVSMNTAYKIHEAEYILKQSDTHTLIYIKGYQDSNYQQIINELCPELALKKPAEKLHAKRLPFLRNVITVGFKTKGALTFKESLNFANNVPLETVLRMASAVDKNDVCNMQYTSGTTGFPRGVMLTHYNVVNNGKCIGDRMDLSTADRMMIEVPMFHCFGMVLSMTAAITHASSILPLPYFSAKPALDCINREHITCFHGVPTMFIALLAHPDFPKTDFSYMRTGIMAGSPCPIAVMKEVVEKMHMTEITIVYGQTEASPGCTMSSVDDPIEVRVGTVGRALPEIECKIVDPETGEECPDEVTGEFVARGYNVMKGYYKMPEATAAAIDKDGWLHTGDLACKTKEGNYRITGRLKDMIIRGGENIYPKEIEEFIYTHPKVKDVQVIGVPDERLGEEILASIVLKEGETMTETEMKDYIKSHMAKHKVPKYVDFVEGFPMNVAGKILKYKMREDAIKKYNLKKGGETA